MLATLITVTVGLLMTLVCRKPVRQLFGASPAFTLWLLPVLLAALPFLPSMPLAWAALPTTLVLPAARALVAHTQPSVSSAPWAMALWISGTLFCLLRLFFRHAGLLRQIRPLPPDMLQALRAETADVHSRLVRVHANGPAVLWAPRSLLLLPADFFERFDPVGRRLVLQHELAHLSRGDTWWSLLAELAAAALWFHPLTWLAMPRFQLDQELACDEHVLRQSPGKGLIYANTLLQSAGIGMNAAPTLIPWLAKPQLKERLTMIKHFRPGALRRHIGFIGVATLMLGVAAVAQAAVVTHGDPEAKPDVAYDAAINPQYPASAVKNHEQGTVVLKVLVGKDGKAQTISAEPTSDASPALVKAATDAVGQWHFTPGMRDGKPIAAYARVPVRFAMTAEPTAPLPPPPPKPPQSLPAPPPPNPPVPAQAPLTP